MPTLPEVIAYVIVALICLLLSMQDRPQDMSVDVDAIKRSLKK